MSAASLLHDTRVDKPLFMSTEHVALMNELLGWSVEIVRLCAELDRNYVVAYALADGPDGQPVDWRMKINRRSGVRISLGSPDIPADVTIRGDYASMIRASRDARQGRMPANPFVIEGEPAVIEQVSRILAAARSVATVDVQFPDG